MRTLRYSLPGRTAPRGGAISYLTERIYREVAYIAYHFNWSREDIMSMNHFERQKWIKEIAAINTQINASNARISGAESE